jgi:hypothetical protein
MNPNPQSALEIGNENETALGLLPLEGQNEDLVHIVRHVKRSPLRFLGSIRRSKAVKVLQQTCSVDQS